MYDCIYYISNNFYYLSVLFAYTMMNVNMEVDMKLIMILTGIGLILCMIAFIILVIIFIINDIKEHKAKVRNINENRCTN